MEPKKSVRKTVLAWIFLPVFGMGMFAGLAKLTDMADHKMNMPIESLWWFLFMLIMIIGYAICLVTVFSDKPNDKDRHEEPRLPGGFY